MLRTQHSLMLLHWRLEINISIKDWSSKVNLKKTIFSNHYKNTEEYFVVGSQ